MIIMPMVLSSAFRLSRPHASLLSSIGLVGLFADEWPRPSFAALRKGKPASFGLFPVGSYAVVYRAGRFLPTLFGLLKAIG
jgi:hypothetical protein